jgi:hypothetical protein
MGRPNLLRIVGYALQLRSHLDPIVPSKKGCKIGKSTIGDTTFRREGQVDVDPFRSRISDRLS